ncbi:Hypothetical predicted protein [Cloeon dipterum]|uniref:WH2 domain-containing protein n=1 Tax=Cloeon dipterum TaxID=197152 RepID=A0A8S1BXA6_9INSE|nr:Hypothetical predicted protein [Cloeon dipterum]
MLDNPRARVLEVESSVPPNPPVPRARRLTPDVVASAVPPPVRPRRLPAVEAAIRRQVSSTSLVGSIGSSSGSSVFGIGRSVLSFNLASEAGSEHTYEDIENDDLDLSLFEGSTASGSTFRRTTDILFEDDEEYVKFHNSLLSERKRSSITKHLDDAEGKKKPKRKKAQAPKAPKPIGYRNRPKLGDIMWKTETEESEKKVTSPTNSVEKSSVFDKPSRSSSLLRKTSAEFGKSTEEEQVVEVSSRDYMLHSQMSSYSTRSDLRDEFGFLTFKPAPGEYEEVVTTSTDDLDLDLDLFAMSNSGSGDKEGTENPPSADLPRPSEPVAVVQTENGHSDHGNGALKKEDELRVEVQVQSMDVGKDDESEYASDDEYNLDSAFQSVTDVLEKQLEAEQLLLQQKQKIVEVVNEEELSRTPSPNEQRQRDEALKQVVEEEKEETQEEEKKVKILKELDRKRAQHEKQRMEIERLQKEQEELEMALKKYEQESTEQKEDSVPVSPEPAEILNWEYKLPAPPSAFRDTKETTTPSNTPEEEKKRLSFDSDSVKEVKEKPKIEAPLPDIIMQQPEVRIEQQEEVKESIPEEAVELRPKPPAIVDVTPKPSVARETRSASPPKVTMVPLRSSQSLCSLVYDHEEQKKEAVKVETPPRRSSSSDSDSDLVQSPLRKTTSVDNVSKMAQNTEGDEEEKQRLQQLQQQVLNWQKQLLTNQSVLQEHVNMPLQSLQVLREILPQMKQKLEEDALNGTSTTTVNESYTTRSSTLPRNARSLDVDSEAVLRSSSSSSTLERRTMTTTTTTSNVQQRFRPPTINLGTWSDRPKSEIALKHDSDYKVGVGKLQARAAPIIRQAEPKPKPENLNLLGSSGEHVTRSNSWRVTQQPPYKSSVTIHSLATEQVRASNKPTVVLRPASFVPQSHSQDSEYAPRPTSQKRYTTLVGLNGAPQPSMVAPATPSYPKQVVIAQVAPAAPFPVVKGFQNSITKEQSTPVKISPLTAPKPSSPTPVPPPPPQFQKPMVIRPTTAPKKKQPPPAAVDSQAELMDAIRNFGGRSNLKRVK